MRGGIIDEPCRCTAARHLGCPVDLFGADGYSLGEMKLEDVGAVEVER